jgi:drug/metabolite transporter (DMT)-like permease
VSVRQQVEGNHAVAGRDLRARLMLVVLCLIWGLTWPMMKIALNEIPPLSMRTATAFIGTLSLLAICLASGRSLRVPFGRAWLHVLAASILNVVAFSLFSAFAQIAAATSRVAILTYAMPIWTLVLGWAVLSERPSRIQSVAIALCAIGLIVLVSPVAMATTGMPWGLLFAIGSGFSWAAGTVYLKWARIDADPVGLASWQITIAFVIIAACMLLFEGGLQFQHAHAGALLAVVFTGVLGNAVAYALWFAIVRRVPALTATLGIVGIPVVGVVSTMLIIGERLSVADTIGFLFIFAASLCAQIPVSAFRRATKVS